VSDLHVFRCEDGVVRLTCDGRTLQLTKEAAKKLFLTLSLYDAVAAKVQRTGPVLFRVSADEIAHMLLQHAAVFAAASLTTHEQHARFLSEHVAPGVYDLTQPELERFAPIVAIGGHRAPTTPVTPAERN
jgi:hypothetical protein